MLPVNFWGIFVENACGDKNQYAVDAATTYPWPLVQ